MDNKELENKLAGIMPLNEMYAGWKAFKKILEENGGELIVKFTLDVYKAKIEKK